MVSYRLLRYIVINFRLHARKLAVRRLGIAASKTVSKNRIFKSVTDAKLHDLRKTQLKKRTEAKMLWGVRAYNEWRSAKLTNPDTYDVRILRADLNDLLCMTESDFEYSMCKFLAEVVKVKDGTEYPGRTLYQFCVAIQKYLFSKGLKWKLIDGGRFETLCNVLDNLMKERANQGIGTTVKRAELLSSKEQDEMWSKGILGESTPSQLRDTVLFIMGIHVGLRAGDEHYALHRDSTDRPSQIQFQRNDKGVCCAVYTEDFVTKTNDGGLKSMNKERKIVWVYPSSNKVRCPVCILDKYMSLLPPVRHNRKANFYLRSLECVSPVQWYREQVVGLNTLKKTIKTLAEYANIQGYFTNHSLRRSGTTRLFQAGVDRKIVKEYTGHSSDTVDKYQITSHAQRQQVSEILAGENEQKECSSKEQYPCSSEISVGKTSQSNVVIVNDFTKIAETISNVIKSNKGHKATIKMSIEIDC